VSIGVGEDLAGGVDVGVEHADPKAVDERVVRDHTTGVAELRHGLDPGTLEERHRQLRLEPAGIVGDLDDATVGPGYAFHAATVGRARLGANTERTRDRVPVP
jgi:hypothetical protein